MSRYLPPIVLVALLAVTTLRRLAQARPSGDPDLIKIVSSLPRTGSAKAQTDTIVNGIKIALDEAGYKAGDFEIVYADWDDATAGAGQWTAEAETANAARAVRDPDVMVYIGTYNSGAAKISMPILNKAHLLMISPANTWPGLTKPDKGDPGEPDIYRPTGDSELRCGWCRPTTCKARWAPPGPRRWASSGSTCSTTTKSTARGSPRLFIEACQDLGIEVLGHESIDSKAQEFKPLMATIKGEKPDLVYFGGTTQSKGGQIAKDMVAAGLDCKLMVPDACYEEAFIESAGAENVNDRCYVTFGGLPPERARRARQGVRREVHGSATAGKPEGYAIYGYEAAKVALEAIARAGVKDREAIRKACLAIKDFDKGALGTWSFDANGDTTLTTISGNIVHDGQFEFVKLLGQ